MHVEEKEDNMYTTSIKKWGNSLALRIPQIVANELNFSPETQVELEVEEGELHIKLKSTPKYTLEELLAGITQDNLHEEIDFGPPVGQEIW